MRVTEQIIISDFLRNIAKNRATIQDLQQKVASQKRVSRPSDDPISAEAILRYNSALQKNEIYKKNVSNAISNLETTFDTIDEVLQALTDLRTITLSASNTEESTMLSTYADEVQGVLDRVLGFANTKFNGKYVFAGTQTLIKPYTYDGTSVNVSSKGVDGKILIDIGSSEKEVMNISGSDVFNGTKLFETIISIRDSLKNQDKPSSTALDEIDDRIDEVNTQFGKIGAITERFQAVQSQLENEGVRLESYLGQENDIDIAETIVKLTQVQTNLEAAFRSWSGVLQKTLFNFLS